MNGKDKALKLALFHFSSENDNDEVLLKFNLWSRYFFPQYFESEDGDFHEDINSGNLDAYRGVIDYFVDVAFRGAGKDVKTKLFIAYTVLNDKDSRKKFYKILTEDVGNAKQIVTDIYNMFVNPRLSAYYPNVFGKTVFKREETMNAFTTAKGVKVLADTVGTEQRGAIQEESRPDFLWFNDFESRKTLRSAVISKSIKDNMEEARTSLQKGGCVIYTCNYISEMGNVHTIIHDKQSSRKRVLMIPIIKDEVKRTSPVDGKVHITGGKPTWERYTIKEIDNMFQDDDDFDGERLCKPNASKDIYFDRAMLDVMPVRQPIEEIAGFKMFRKYNPSHRYAGGHDIAGGIGLDSSTSVFIDFDCVPAQVVGTFASNTILPEAFGDEIYSQSKRFGKCLVAPENNKFDQTILKARQLGAKLYTSLGKIIKIYVAAPTTFGWNTNSLTKSSMYSSAREAIESGLVELNDKALIDEAKAFNRNDLIDNAPDIRLTTRHFDLLTAFCIAWQMKDHARPTKLPDFDFDAWKGTEKNEAI